MNRQQRREMARRQAVENKYWNQLVERQNRVDDRKLELGMTAIAIALYNIYGWEEEEIVKVLQEYNKQICRIASEGLTYEDLKKELEEKTGFYLKWAN